eukprot:m.79562 g.79562  ORF g.79562 m.79562 type:complete len:288 (+) comp8008_c0_seq4:183-1046(+)
MAYAEREWASPAAAWDFSVMSFNLLAEDLLRKYKHLYAECNVDTLDWATRSGMILSEIRHVQPDIVCLQEVQRDHFGSCYAGFFDANGYEALFVPRTRRTDGCAIAFKRDRFELLDETASSAITYEFAGTGMQGYDYGNVGQLAFLCARTTPPRVLCVANTHILFDPRRGDIKLLQVRTPSAPSRPTAHQHASSVHAHMPALHSLAWTHGPTTDLLAGLTPRSRCCSTGSRRPPVCARWRTSRSFSAATSTCSRTAPSTTSSRRSACRTASSAASRSRARARYIRIC